MVDDQLRRFAASRSDDKQRLMREAELAAAELRYLVLKSRKHGLDKVVFFLFLTLFFTFLSVL